MADRFPEKFGKYKIVEEVGRGGFADVYKAIDTTLNRTVALKLLEPQLLREPTFVERFQREAQLAANLKHPNIVIIHEFGWEAGAVYMAMEFLEGETLKEVILQEGALHPRRIVNMVGQIALALDYAQVRREVTYGQSRLDLVLEGGPEGGRCFIEAKSVTLVEDGVALFPDAPTQRGRRHLSELARARAKGYRAAVVFVVQRDDAILFSPHDEADPAFGQALREAAQADVEVYAYKCRVSEREVTLDAPLPVADLVA